jgi:uncharacterized protein YqgC (DUF456 family)
MLWGIAIIYSVLTNFQHVTWLAIIVITILALLSIFRDFWLPLLGMKSRGVSCSSVVGTIIGGTIGTFIIPFPLIGTLIGAVIGALIFEMIRLRDMRQSIKAAGFALESFLYSLIVEFVINLAIVITFFASVLIQ